METRETATPDFQFVFILAKIEVIIEFGGVSLPSNNIYYSCQEKSARGISTALFPLFLLKNWEMVYWHIRVLSISKSTLYGDGGKMIARVLGSREISPALARKIMGGNFYGPEEQKRLTPSSLSLHVPVPFTHDLLQRHREDHALIYIPPISIRKMFQIVPQHFQTMFSGYANESFASSWGHARWHLIAKAPLPHSPNKTWDEQCVLLEDGASVPSARSLSYLVIAHYHRTGEVLFENNPGRSSSSITTSNGRQHIAVRCFQSANSPLSIVFIPRPDGMALALTGITQEVTTS